jgi:hypothetical protein
MQINEILKGIIVVGCWIVGSYFLVVAYRNRNSSVNRFKIKHLFKNNPMRFSSTTQLVIEGLFVIFAGVLGYIYL